MTAFKCKMCGASLEVPEGATSVTCDYCRTQQTLPRLDDDRRANLYDRGNHFRRASEYDKAMRIFEQVLSEDANDAEAYWSIVLCRYGVEYVEDPATGRRIPTVNRMQASSILADEDYRQALAHADLVQRGIYESQAKEIAAIQEGIAEVAAKEEPFDVFICYKETDAQGQRTRDSVLANDLYHELTREGFRVFFARITLEDKLGQAYEPYIYSALQSSKAMVVIGTKPEYVKAPWVKNEWSRYLALIKAGARKTLIPAYRDMDPYDLPEEFSHLQAQDMSKLGFMQDLVRGIKKICGKDERPTQVSQTASVPVQAAGGASGTASSLLKRANIFLADGEWDRASEYAERVLDIDPENAEAYLVKVMVELEVKDRSELSKYGANVMDAEDYEKVAKYAKGEFAKEHARIRHEALKTQFDIACEYAEKAQDLQPAEAEKRWKEIAEEFEWAEEYPGAAERVQECRRRAVEAGRANHFNNACALVEEAQDSDAEVAAEVWEHAAQEFELAAEHPQAQERAQECRKRMEQARQLKTACDLVKEAETCRLVGAQEAWERAAQAFDSADDYPQAQERAQQCYERAMQAARNLDEANRRIEEASELAKKNQGRFEAAGVDHDGSIRAEFERIHASVYDLDELAAARKVFEVCTDGARKARDSRLAEHQLQAARKRKRNLIIGVCVVVVIAAGAAAYTFVIQPAMITSQAEGFVASGDYESAIELYEENERLEDANAVRLDWAKALETAGDYEQAIGLYEGLGMGDAADAAHLAWVKALENSGNYASAVALCEDASLANSVRLDWAQSCEASGDYEQAVGLYEQLGRLEEADAARLAWAKSLEGSGDFMAAADLYEQLGMGDEADAARLARARELEASGDYASAVALCEDAGLADDAGAARLAWAKSLEASGDFLAAADLYDGLGMADEADAARLARARELESAGEYAAAADLYEQLGKDKEAKDCLSNIFTDVEVGDTVIFGSYEQDNNEGNGKEAIEWVVLDKQGDKALLVSKYALDSQPYNTKSACVRWESCTLRSWLNDSFLNDAFTKGEQLVIDKTQVINADNAARRTPGGNPTVDKVFLLSIDEAEEYFASDSARACSTTSYARGRGSWWLRSPGDYTNRAALVDSDGSISVYGLDVDWDGVAVRPAMWINL